MKRVEVGTDDIVTDTLAVSSNSSNCGYRELGILKEKILTFCGNSAQNLFINDTNINNI
jgi:hypothetical protein